MCFVQRRLELYDDGLALAFSPNYLEVHHALGSIDLLFR